MLGGKVAFVTGASRGIGKACAELLAREGAKVAIGYREDKDGALQASYECQDSQVVQIDVRNSQSVGEAFDEVEGSLGPVSILVNNAGLTRDGLFLRMSDEDWDDVIDTNLNGVFRCTRRAIRPMVASGWGRVVNIGSVAGLTGNAGQTNYSASKAALAGFSKALSREVARTGVTVNVVAPGLVDTALTSRLSDKSRDALISKTSIGRAATPEEIADAVGLCIKTPYMTGQVVVVDGGIH